MPLTKLQRRFRRGKRAGRRLERKLFKARAHDESPADVLEPDRPRATHPPPAPPPAAPPPVGGGGGIGGIIPGLLRGGIAGGRVRRQAGTLEDDELLRLLLALLRRLGTI